MIGLFSPSDHNATKTLHALIKGLNAKVTLTTIREQLTMHPEFPSLLSLSDKLTDWKIQNTGLQLRTIDQLQALPLPFVAHLKKKNGLYILITDLKVNQITYIDSNERHKIVTLEQFEENWSGAVLVAQVDEQSGEINYSHNRSKEIRKNIHEWLLIAVGLIVALLVIIGATKGFTILDGFTLLTKATGLIISSLLVAKQLGSINSLTDRLCQISNKIDCDSVLNSPRAKLWGWLNWADVGLIYFMGGLFTSLLMGNQITVRAILNELSLLALPYTIFSIYYQARVVRQWCTLCLVVQVVLIIEGYISITQLNPLPVTWQPYRLILICFLVSFLACTLLKSFLNVFYNYHHQNNELIHLKRNPTLFQAFLVQQPKMPALTDDLNPVVLGNPKAGHTLTMVTNPYCGPCALTHKKLKQLLDQYPNFKIHIIFSVCDRSDWQKIQTVKHMLALSQKEIIDDALINWYEAYNKDYIGWANRFPIYGDLNLYDIELQRHCQWCNEANIKATPTLYVSDYKLPDFYGLDDLQWLFYKIELNEISKVKISSNISLHHTL